MSTIARDPMKPLLMVVAMSYVFMLAAALIWLHLPPLIILGLTLGGAALAVFTFRPILAVHALLLLTQIEGPLEGSTTGEMASKALGVIVVFSWLLNTATDRRRQIRFDGLFLAMAAFLCWCGLLLFVAIDARAAAGRTLTVCQLIVAAIMISSVVDTPAKLRGIYWSIVGWTTFSAGFGVLQYLTGVTEMASGLVGNRNVLAVYINLAIVCAYLLYQSTRNPIAKLILALSTPILLIALALTFSRGGLLVLGVVMIVLIAKAARDRSFLILIVSSALICLMTLFLPGAFWNRASTIVPSIQKQEGTFGLRVNLWAVGMRMIADHPIRGVGPGNFTIAFPRYARGVMLKTSLGAHNSYVSVAAETGLIGLSLFLMLHFLAFKRVRRASLLAAERDDPTLVNLALAAEAMLLVMMLSGLSGHLEYSKYLWILFGLTISITRMPAASMSADLEPLSKRDDRLLPLGAAAESLSPRRPILGD